MSGADWAGVGLGTLGSLLVAVGLWIVLPRGVALTKLHPVTDWRGEVLLDTWRLRNVSALPIQIETVAYMHFGMAEPKDLPTDGISTCSLSFDDEVLDTGRTERDLRWRGVTVPPGESLTAHVGVNHTLTVRYRRAGLGGRFERRSILVHGYS
jgi:hypothetical protein